MKKKFLCFLVLIPFMGNSQISEFKIKELYVIDPIVLQIENTTVNSLYLKATDWLKYVEPEAKIISLESNDFIRFEKLVRGFRYIEFKGQSFYDNVYLTFRVDFKEGKYRISLEDYYMQVANNTNAPKRKLEDYCKGKNGEINQPIEESKKGFYDSESAALIIAINKINKSLYDYLSDKTKDKNSDW